MQIQLRKITATLPCLLLLAGLAALVLPSGFPAHAQQQRATADTADKVTIQILGATTMTGLRQDTSQITKFIGNVRLRQGTTDMTCDSVYLNPATNNLEAFGNVHLFQPGGTEVLSDYLRYIGNKRLAYLKGNVKLNDGRNSLWSEELTYDVGSKIAVYASGGTLQSDETTLSSNTGTYNVNTKDARFREEVIVTNPRYNTTSEDLGYNTASKVVTFFGPKISTVTNDKSTLRTTGGTYNTEREQALFTSRTSLQDKEQYVEGDRIDYDRNTGYGKATGHVIAIDTARHITMWSGFAAYNEKRRTLLSTIKPVLRQMNGRDSLFLRSDTFFSAPVRMIRAAMKALADTGRRKGRRAAPAQEALIGDSTAPRYYTGYHHVLIFSDSLQGRCDSISYSEQDSVLRMMQHPVAWSRNSQITGDTILLYMDSSRLRRLFVPANAFIASLAGPPKAGLYDQIQGKTLTAHFERNTITDMIVVPNAEVIHYEKDDSGAYLGVNQVSGERMRVLFRDEGIHTIIFEQEIKQSLTPLDQADLPNMKLSRFKWLEGTRPKSREELFE